MITIGIDPHKSSLTAVAIDATGQHLADRRFPVNAGTFTQVVKLVVRDGRNGDSPSRALTGLDVASPSSWPPPMTSLLTFRPPSLPASGSLATGGGRKTDVADAASVAHVALHHPCLRQVVAEDQTTILRLLAERRRRPEPRTHPRPQPAPWGATGTRAGRRRRRVVRRQSRSRTAHRPDAHCHRRVSPRPRPRPAGATFAASTGSSKPTRRCNATPSPPPAAPCPKSTASRPYCPRKILGHVGDVNRFPTADHFASYTGTLAIGRL